MFQLLYPEYRKVSEQTILGWFRDAVADGEVDDMDGYTVRDAIESLEDAGLITVQHD